MTLYQGRLYEFEAQFIVDYVNLLLESFYCIVLDNLVNTIEVILHTDADA